MIALSRIATRSQRPLRAWRIPIAVMVASLIGGGAPDCFGQARVSSGRDQETTLEGGTVVTRFTEPRGRQGTLRAELRSLDLDGSFIVDYAPFIALNCRAGAKCIVGTMRNTGMTIRAEGERARSAGAEDTAVDHIDVHCGTVGECQAFLRALKDAANADHGSGSGRVARSSEIDKSEAASTYGPAGARGAAPQRKPGSEPVIDGSRIPNQITFDKPGSTTSASPGAPTSNAPASNAPGRLSAILDDPAQGRRSAGSGAAGLVSIFDSPLPNVPPTASTAKPWMNWEMVGAELFDAARQGRIQSMGDALKVETREFFMDQQKMLAENATSIAFAGRFFNDLPEDFRKDYAVWDAGLKRIFEPFSVKGGYRLVDAFGELLDLWGKP